MGRILQKSKHGDLWEMVLSKKDFDRWVKKVGYSSYKDFTRDTGVAYSEIKGKWFQMVDNRIFIRTKKEMRESRDW